MRLRAREKIMAHRVKFILVSISVLAVMSGCSASLQHDDAYAEGVRLRESDSSGDLALSVEQPEAPVVMGAQRRVPVRFEVTVANQLASPVTIRRISLQSAGGGSLQIPLTNRKFERTLAPSASAVLDFWADVVVGGTASGSVRGPIALRATVAYTADGAERSAVFMRQVGGSVMVGVSP
jgi:hypothetical protein